MESLSFYAVAAPWFVVIPAAGGYGMEHIDLNEVAVISLSPDFDAPAVQLTLKSGVKLKFYGTRAEHLIIQWDLYRSKLPSRNVATVG